MSQTIFGSPNDPDQNVVRQLVAQSLWTQTFVYDGTPTVDITLHLSIPALQVQLLGVPPNRDNPGFTETAQASARVDTVITHADGTFAKGGSFEFGLREFETRIPDGTGTFLNFADVDFIGTDGPLFDTFVCNFVGACNIDSVFTDVDLGVLVGRRVLSPLNQRLPPGAASTRVASSVVGRRQRELDDFGVR